jgi:hypothetical protein
MPVSNLNSIFIIMSELKFFLLTKVLIQNFNIVDLVKFLQKNQNLQIQIVVVRLKMTSCKALNKTSHLGRGPSFVGGGGFIVWAKKCLQC